jgi:hypothetical protein
MANDTSIDRKILITLNLSDHQGQLISLVTEKGGNNSLSFKFKEMTLSSNVTFRMETGNLSIAIQIQMTNLIPPIINFFNKVFETNFPFKIKVRKERLTYGIKILSTIKRKLNISSRDSNECQLNIHTANSSARSLTGFIKKPSNILQETHKEFRQNKNCLECN